MFSIHLPYSAVTCNKPIRENSSALKSVLKRTKLPFCSLQHILYLLEKKLNAFDRNIFNTECLRQQYCPISKFPLSTFC